MKLARNGTRQSQPCRYGLVRQCHQCKGARPQEGAQLDADERQGGEETTTPARRNFRNQRGRAGLLGPRPQALDDAQGHQEDRTQHSRLFERRQQADGETCHAHQADGEDQDHFAAEPVPDVAEDDSTEGTGGKADAVGCKGGDDSTAFPQRSKEQRPEDQRRGEAVNVEVVILQCGAYGAGKSCPSQLVRVDDGAVLSLRCFSTSCHKNSLITLQAPVGLVGQRQHMLCRSLY
jgi:hypothetical protein